MIGKSSFSFDAIWRDLNDRCRQSSFAPGTVSVARCYIVKNRQQDVVPYDKNRYTIVITT